MIKFHKFEISEHSRLFWLISDQFFTLGTTKYNLTGWKLHWYVNFSQLHPIITIGCVRGDKVYKNWSFEISDHFRRFFGLFWSISHHVDHKMPLNWLLITSICKFQSTTPIHNHLGCVWGYQVCPPHRISVGLQPIGDTHIFFISNPIFELSLELLSKFPKWGSKLLWSC